MGANRPVAIRARASGVATPADSLSLAHARSDVRSPCVSASNTLHLDRASPGAVTANLKARVFYRLFKRLFSFHVVTSEAMATCLEGYGVPRERIEMIPSAVPVS